MSRRLDERSLEGKTEGTVYLSMPTRARPQFLINNYLFTDEFGHFTKPLRIIQPRLPQLEPLEQGSPDSIKLWNPPIHGSLTLLLPSCKAKLNATHPIFQLLFALLLALSQTTPEQAYSCEPTIPLSNSVWLRHGWAWTVICPCSIGLTMQFQRGK